MKKRFIKVILLFIAVFALAFFFRKDLFFNIDTVRAFGELSVDFHVPIGDPIFTVNNMVPGDSSSKNVDVTNGGTITRMILVKGIKKSDIGADPKLQTVLNITIKDGSNVLYGTGSTTGPKTVKDFLIDSNNPNGVQLNMITPSGHKTYTFTVTFPNSAGNEYQAKSVVFDLTFGVMSADNVVINEVYYKVDSAHGMDSPKDRGIFGVNGNNVTIVIQGNGAHSVNKVVVNQQQACAILQSNKTNIVNGVTAVSNSGNNTAVGNTGGSTTIISGSSQSIVSIFNTGSINIANGCGNKLGQNDEWVELFNPTDQDISLRNWSITDNTGTPTVINANKTIKAGGFALLSKSASTWNKWNVPTSALKIELGREIGDGLDNAGDHIILKNSSNVEVDRMSWGTDMTGFTPPATNPVVSLGSSTERLAPGFDTNAASDWSERHNPTPGN